MPKVASPEEWRAERIRLLKEEKELTKHHDRVSAARRRLPMVKLDKMYEFDTPEGKKALADLFEGRTQLVVYHFMFDPEWEKGCGGCTGYVDAIGDLSMLHERNTTFALVSRAPLEKLEKYKAERGWDLTWVSSFGSDFNYDMHVTLDESVAPIEVNFESKEEFVRKHPTAAPKGEVQGLSVFFKVGDDVFHTYSTYARGVENLVDSYTILDCTPYGRQEDWEDSPPGWPQKPTYG
jgi:predicted dithiol-disulfide oxidoreductase (DUF899 family)